MSLAKQTIGAFVEKFLIWATSSSCEWSWKNLKSIGLSLEKENKVPLAFWSSRTLKAVYSHGQKEWSSYPSDHQRIGPSWNGYLFPTVSRCVHAWVMKTWFMKGSTTSNCFADPVSDAYTNIIERTWWNVQYGQSEKQCCQILCWIHIQRYPDFCFGLCFLVG